MTIARENNVLYFRWCLTFIAIGIENDILVSVVQYMRWCLTFMAIEREKYVLYVCGVL